MDLLKKVADELKLNLAQVEGVDALLKEGASVPFIARYRKERSHGLDETKIRAIKQRLQQCGELEQRRAVALKAIDESGLLTPELKTRLENAATKVELEDLYMPYRTRRRVRSAAARQKGLEGLADLIWKPFPNLDARSKGKSGGGAEKSESPASTESTEPKSVAEPAPEAPAATSTVEPITVPVAPVAPVSQDQGDATPSPEAAQSEVPVAPAVAAESPITAEPAPTVPTVEAFAAVAEPAAPAAPVAAAATTSDVEEIVKPFINAEKGVKDIAEALSGARDCVAERLSEDATCRKIARDLLWSDGKLVCKPREGINLSKGKYAAFAQFSEPLGKVPPHRVLTLMRGAAEKQLSLIIEPPREKILQELKSKIVVNPDAPLKLELSLAIEEGYDRLLAPSLDNEIRQDLKRRADLDAIEIMARNLRALLLQPPLGRVPVIAAEAAADKSLRLVVLDANGKLGAHIVVNPEKGPDERKKASEELAKLIKDHGIKAVAISSGTGSREVDLFVREVLKSGPIEGVIQTGISETGAVLFAAAPESREEFPEIDAATRGTIFIGRRLQDPLAQLIKIDPNALALGPHQHETDQALLKQRLDEVVESCANFVGADANAAAASFLRHIAGLNAELAKKTVETRKAKGDYKSRDELRDTSGLTAYAFVQSAGFLRIQGENPLDATAVHPENYALVETIAKSVESTAKDLLGNEALLSKLDLSKFKSGDVSEAMLKDIRDELKKAGADPRGVFANPGFNEELKDLSDLKPGMLLNGVVSSLTPFGAFVNIGVHQDGLVHISAITHKFIRDPSDALTLGQHVKVKVVGVETDRKRISLSMKELEAPPAPRQPRPQRGATAEGAARPPRSPRPQQQRTPSSQSAQAGQTGQPAAAGSTDAAGSAPRRDNRPPRFERRPRPDNRNAAPAAAGQAAPPGTPAATSGSPVTTGAPVERRNRFDGRARSSENKPREGARTGPSDGRRDAPREPAKPPPGQPDYSKFFVKPKRKERDNKTQRTELGASRQEVRDLMKQQNSGGTSLADLLRKAGVVSEDEK